MRYRKDVSWHLKYLKEIRELDEATINHFEIGYDETKTVYTYPYIEDGKLVHFKYKYKNKVWHLSGNSGGDYLFNSRGLNQSTVLFVEGEHDVCSIWQHYRVEAVGIGGKLGERSVKHTKIVEACRGKNVWLCFDDDDAGRKYTSDFIRWLSEVALEVREIGHTGEGKDPDEWLRSGGELLLPYLI